MARQASGPWRGTWAVLAGDRTAFGMDRTMATAATGARALPERESLEVLRSAVLSVTPAVAVPDADAAVEAARPLGGHTVVLKIDAVDLPHKTDLGLVRLGVRGDEAIRAAADDLLRDARRHGVDARGLLVEPMADPGLELIVGMRRDPSFGACVMVGLGGVLAEVLDDVAIRLAPVTQAVAHEMLDQLRAAQLLAGTRGRPAVDRAAVVELVVALSRLAIERPDLVEIDLKPVIASTGGAVAVDALVVLAAPGSEAPRG